MHKKQSIPLKKQRVFNVSVRDDLLPWWNGEVEPRIRKSYKGNRTAFIMDAIREKIEKEESNGG
jgi:metal-responsive CopG/Arc/MetJ family transcriptional regulator